MTRPGNPQISQKVKAHAESLRPVIERLQGEGVTSYQDLAYALRTEGIKTYHGSTRWYGTTVMRMMGHLNRS